MNKKLIGFIIIFLGALIMLGFLYLMFADKLGLPDVFSFLKNDKAVEEISKKQADDNGSSQPAEAGKEIKRITINPKDADITQENKSAGEKREFTKDDLSRMAESFAERFGSYSNQSNFNNIVDLKLFMSEEMKEWADSYVSGQRGRQIASDIYYGITTKAVGREIREYDDDAGQASVFVQTRRREATSSTSNTSKVFDQDIIIKFIKEKGAWKVDGANWL
ncbi:hypothetical protein DRH27_01075 [Candidatus Falkowbacteria bacterium]|nr:MAG: hypothetical protein DRH27_01075 [Candidatus Falkowbacteria bacterium]